MIPSPYLLYLGNSDDPLAIKTARGVAHWRPDKCIGQRRLSADSVGLGLTDMTYTEAARRGARTVLLGIANRGGTMTPQDRAEILEAFEAGLDVASGLHKRLRDDPEIAEAARRLGRTLYDVRSLSFEVAVGNGVKRPGDRLLTVGTDCSVGKMFTTLALEQELRSRGVNCNFRATGQTGIMIAGDGVPVDAVIADFISGAIEHISPARHDGGLDLIEGQGSLFHPSYAGVSLGLLHGAQPDALVLCHEVDRPHMRGLPGRALPELAEVLEANINAAGVTNPDVQAVGIALNTSRLSAAAGVAYRTAVENEFNLPVEDPVVTGVSRIADRILECFEKLRPMANVGS